MNLSDINLLLPLIVAVCYTILLVVSLIRRGPQEKQLKWWFAFLAASVAWEFILFFTPSLAFIPNLAVKVLTLATICLGGATAVYLQWPTWRRWVILSILAVAATVGIDLLQPTLEVSIPGLALPTITYGQLTSYLTWLVLSFLIFSKSRREYRQTTFPWHANRLVFWITALFTLGIGELFTFLPQPLLQLIGQGVRFGGVLGLTYSVTSYHLFDVRNRARRVLAFIVITVVSAIPLTIIILLVQWFTRRASFNTTLLLTAVILVVSFFLYQPFRRIVERVTYRFLRGEPVDPRKVVRDYSQAISRTLEVQQLSLLMIGTLSELLETKRGALLLVTKTDNGFDIDPIPALGIISRQRVHFKADSLFINSILAGHQPLLSYDVEFNPEYINIDPTEKTWLKEIAMEVYIPITSGTILEGLIALGPKNSGLPYQHSELELVQILADQTVVALQNARLYSELGSQNDKIRRLNLDLISQNERLEVMDRVKSDFITIASHELRTPLTQVKGYADILAAMNDENALTREQTREIVSHINRATLRLEGLISAMLDASQIDVEGMQLSFVETRIDTIVRLAAEPLTAAMRERRLTFTMEISSDLPPIQADFKRLVQAFTNLLGNAVKYTPDNGRITATASLAPSHNGTEDFIEVVIADTGIGIEPKFHDLIFEKFFRVGDPQLHSTGSTKFKGAGPGLGLPITKGVVEAHGGRIWVESEGEDETRLSGSRFHVLIPLKPPAQLMQAASKVQIAQKPSYMMG